MRQVKEFVIKHQIANMEITGKGIPIKRHQAYRYVVKGLYKYLSIAYILLLVSSLSNIFLLCNI